MKITSGSPILRYAGFVCSVTGAKTVGIVITSITFPYIVRRLGVEAYGQWSYVVALSSFLNVIADPGMNVFLTQQVAAQKTAAFESIPDVLFLRLIASLIAALAVLLISSHEPAATVRLLLRLYGFGILFASLIVTDHLLTALELFHVRSLLNVTQQLVYAALVFIFVHRARDLVWLPVGILSSSMLCSVLGWIVLWRKGVRFRARLRPNCWPRILRPSLHYAASSLMSNIYHRTGNVLVRWILGDFALGLYAAAARFVDIVRGFIITFCQVLLPRIAAAESAAQLRRLARLATSTVAVVSIPLTLGLIGTAHLVVPWVLGKNFLAAVPVLEWMAPYLITASAASLFCSTILFGLGRHRAYLASTAAGAAAGTLLYFTLTPAFGLPGAAFALVFAELAVAAVAVGSIPELHDSWKNPVLRVASGSALLMLLAIKVTNVYTSQIFVVLFVGASVYVMSCGWYVRRLFV